MQRTFEDLSLEEMFECHDHTYMMSDDSRYYDSGKYQAKIISNKVKELGGWTQELVDLYNKYAPEGFEKDFEFIKMANKLNKNYDTSN